MAIRFRSLVAGIYLAAVTTAPMAAQATGDASARQKPVTTFGYLDSNKDARISREEAKVDWAVKQRFAEADTNHDGYIDEEEFKRLNAQDKSPAAKTQG